MNGARAVHRETGERGPVCEFATVAALWVIFTQPDPRNWRIEPVAPPDMPAPAGLFNPASLHF